MKHYVPNTTNLRTFLTSLCASIGAARLFGGNANAGPAPAAAADRRGPTDQRTGSKLEGCGLE